MIKMLLITACFLSIITVKGTHNSAYYREDETKDFYAYPMYYYSYSVNDPETGDEKNQYEMRDGSLVKGYYSVKDADGTTREVLYSSGKKEGFKADINTVTHVLKTPYHRASISHF